MRVCGISIDNRTANIVVLESEGDDLTVLNTAKKIELKDDHSQQDVKEFHMLLAALCREHDVAKVGIRSRQTKGGFAGGPLTFKIEGIIQMLDRPVELVHPATIKAALKRGVPQQIDEVYKYQRDAFSTAFVLIGR